MHNKIALKATLFLSFSLPFTVHAFSIEEYRNSMIDAYRAAFAGVCVADTVSFSAADSELKPGAVALEADQTEIVGKSVIFSGNAELEKDGMMVSADKLSYDKETDSFAGDGNIRIQDPSGNVFQAQKMEMEVETLIGSAEDVKYTLTSKTGAKSPEGTKYISAHGVAKSIDFEGHDLVVLHDATYSTCRKDKEIAVLNAGEIELDKSAGVGKAKNMKLRLFDVPVFWFPYVSFALDNDRKTGFLMPSIGSTDRSGTVIKVPYYINIKPNMDATLGLNYYSKRGAQLQGEYRYLTKGGKGNFNGAYLSDDKETGENRYGYKVDLRQKLASRWDATVNYAEVSDDDYFEDFSGNLLLTSATFLRQEGRVDYSGSWLRADALYSRFQTIDETIPEADRPYKREPAISFSTNIPKVNNFRFDAYGSYTDFQRTDRVSGPRSDLGASVAYDFREMYGFFKPKATFRYTAYDLTDVAADEVSDPDRSLGIFSLDSGLYFDKQSFIKGKDFTTTLEPRLFYLYVPYEDQTDIPLFDTGENTFSMGTMFRENRFTGPDRIGDANQLTASLTSRLIDADSGDELLRGTLGQIYYFDDRQVSLSTDPTLPQTFGRSDFVAELYTRISNKFYMYNFFQYNSEQSELGVFNTDLRYTKDARRGVNLGYYNRNNTSQQLNADVAWALAPRWQFNANARYDLEVNDFLRGGIGVGYNACCWGFRVDAQRRIDNNSEYVNAVMFQIELNGLTKIKTGF
ncbi:MAG: LPS assembly protein LptD [Pseudomonadota bacterium]|nr:LPS assembly protein LptD [Pseudomonadota bacterium]